MKDKVRMTVFVLVLGSILTTALVGVDAYTAPLIEQNRLRKVHGSVMSALGIGYDAVSVEETFAGKIRTKPHSSGQYYVSDKGDIAFEIVGSGLWGPIEGVLAMDASLETIRGVTIVHQEETPGLGSRIADKDYLDGFVGKKVTPRLVVTAEGKAATENEVNGITGATLSCKALEAVLNNEAKRNVTLIRESAQ